MRGDVNVMEVWRGQAAARAADALLQALGGFGVHLRVLTGAAVTGDGGQLGLEAAALQDVPLAPAVIRNTAQKSDEPYLRSELLISASRLASEHDIHDVEAAREFFMTALGVVVGGKLLAIASFAADEFGGVPYLYRLIVRE